MTTRNNTALLKANIIKRKSLDWVFVQLPQFNSLEAQENVSIAVSSAPFLPRVENSIIQVPISLIFNEIPFAYNRSRVFCRVVEDSEGTLRGVITGMGIGYEPSKTYRIDRTKLRVNLRVTIGVNIYKICMVIYSPTKYTQRTISLINRKLTHYFMSVLPQEGIFGFLRSLFVTKKAIHNLRKLVVRNTFQLEHISLVSGLEENIIRFSPAQQ